MARIKSQATLTKSYIPGDAEAMGLSIDPYNEYARLILYDGKNFLPTPTGYKSEFGKVVIGATTDPELPEYADEAFTYRTKAGDTILLALCAGGVYARTLDRGASPTVVETANAIDVDFSLTGSMQWTKLFYSPLGSSNPWKLWTYAIIRNELYLYQKGLKYIAKLTGEEPGKLHIDKLQPSFIISTASALYRYKVDYQQEYGNSTYKELIINGISYRVDVNGSVKTWLADSLFQEALASPYNEIGAIGYDRLADVGTAQVNTYDITAMVTTGTLTYEHDGQSVEFEAILEWIGNTASFFMVRSWPEYDAATGNNIGRRVAFITEDTFYSYLDTSLGDMDFVGYLDYLGRSCTFVSPTTNYTAVRMAQSSDESWYHTMLDITQTQDNSFELAGVDPTLFQHYNADTSDILEVNGVLHTFSAYDLKHYESADGGVTWTSTLTTNFDLIADYESEIIYYGGNFISLGGSKHSPDGNIWISDSDGFGKQFTYYKNSTRAHGFGGKLYVSDGQGRIYHSTTGYSTWAYSFVEQAPGMFMESPDGTTLYWITTEGTIYDVVGGTTVAGSVPIVQDTQYTPIPTVLVGAFTDSFGRMNLIYEAYQPAPAAASPPFTEARKLDYDLSVVGNGFLHRLAHIQYQGTSPSNLVRVTSVLDGASDYAYYCYEDTYQPKGLSGYTESSTYSKPNKVY